MPGASEEGGGAAPAPPAGAEDGTEPGEGERGVTEKTAISQS